MCGLAGCFTSSKIILNKDQRLARTRVIEALLVANQVRGTDGTGVAAISMDGKSQILKRAEASFEFVDKPDASAFLRRNVPLLMGHTRMTSMGNDVIDANAHPFKEGNVIGAHNGIINNYLKLDKTVRVDSQAVLRLLDEHPDNYDYAFSRVEGSCAMTWWDQRDPTGLYMVMHSNPLSVAVVPRIETIFWSSQSEHLESTLRAVYGSNFAVLDLKGDTVYRMDGADPWAWRESKVTFAPYGTNSVRVYSSGIGMGYGHGGYDSDDDYWNRPMADAGSTGASGKFPLVSVAERAMAEMDEDDAEGERYEGYWRNITAHIRGQKDDDENLNADESDKSIHDLTDREFERYDIEDEHGQMQCEFGGHPLGTEGGVYDSGLGLLMCKDCQDYWDRSSMGVEGSREGDYNADTR